MKAGREDALALRRAREPVRKIVFAILFVLMFVLSAIIGPSFGLIGGLIFAFVGGSALTLVYKLTSRAPRGLNPVYTAGAQACPACTSVQTDQTYTRSAEGGEVLVWNCYACDHQWQ